uniref:Membrane protein BRI3 n=1 Tax=Panagrolaimus sp. PS1159 TaxID=55785 RepID=A0AC35FZ80_9BILA
MDPSGQHPPPYASLLNHPPQQQQQNHHYNGNDKYIPMYQYPLVTHQPPPPPLPQPIIMNQAAAAPTSQPTNIVINAQASGGSGNGSGGGNRNVAAHALGGFECPFCHLGVVKRRRNPLIKIFIILIALLTFPFGLLACILCWMPCAYQRKCTTCKKKI